MTGHKAGLLSDVLVSPFLRRLVGGAIWSGLSEGLSRGLMVISMVIIARILGDQAFGEFGLIRTTVGMFATIGGVGLGLTANRFVAQFRDSAKAKAGELIGSTYALAIFFGLATGVVVFLGSDMLAVEVFDQPILARSLRYAAIILVLSSLNGAQIGVLQGLEAYNQLAIANLVQGIVGVGAFTVGAKTAGVDGALYALILYSSVGLIAYQLVIRRALAAMDIRLNFAAISQTLPIFWRFSVPAALMGITIAPFKWLAEAGLARSSGFAELGMFHASMLVANVLFTLVSTINSPLISLTANDIGAAGNERLKYLSMYGGWFLFVVVSLPLIAFPQLPALVFGNAYQGAQLGQLCLLMTLYSGLMLYYQGVLRLITQWGSMWLTLITNVFEGVTLFGVYLLLADWGAVGLCVAYVASYVVRIVVTAPIIMRADFVPRRMIFDKYFLGTLVSISVAAAIQLARAA